METNRKTHQYILITGAVLILIGIVLGAFGAHGLKEKLTFEQLNSFEVGVRYQIYHGLALLIIGFNVSKINFSPSLFYKLILIGVILFSGSIYFFACKYLIGVFPPKIAYLITPLGGVLLISAWFFLVFKLIVDGKQIKLKK